MAGAPEALAGLLSRPAGARGAGRELVGIARVAVPVLARRPSLWPVAVAVLSGLVPSRWWCRPPFLPLPDRRWVAFRLETAYGDPKAAPSAADLVAYLAWARTERRRRHGPGAPLQASGDALASPGMQGGRLEQRHEV